MEEHDYMNDPRMGEFRHLAYPAQEVRAWRLGMQDEIEGMSREQKKPALRLCGRISKHLVQP